jgi:hypothetical protein
VLWILDSGCTYLHKYGAGIEPTTSCVLIGSHCPVLPYHCAKSVVHRCHGGSLRINLLITSPSSFYPYPTMWDQYNMFSSCCNKDSPKSYFLRLAACLTSTSFWEWSGWYNNCKCSRNQWLNVPSQTWRARDNKLLVTHPMPDLCERCLTSAIALAVVPS